MSCTPNVNCVSNVNFDQASLGTWSSRAKKNWIASHNFFSYRSPPLLLIFLSFNFFESFPLQSFLGM